MMSKTEYTFIKYTHPFFILFCVQVKINNPRPACYAVNPLGIFFQTGKLIDKLIFDGIH